jgi:hypothetical protein
LAELTKRSRIRENRETTVREPTYFYRFTDGIQLAFLKGGASWSQGRFQFTEALEPQIVTDLEVKHGQEEKELLVVYGGERSRGSGSDLPAEQSFRRGRPEGSSV